MSSGENRVWDVIVVGAGPSGAVTAYMLAKKGFRTLLVERNSFPRFKVCGGCISARSVKRLESLGLGPRIAKLPGVPLSGVKIANGMGSAIELPLPGGLSMTRAMLDNALVDAAVEAGAHFQFGVHARVLDSVSDSASDSATRSVRLRGDGVPPTTVEARVVVAADGLGHPSLALLPEFGSTVARGSRVGFGTVLQAEEVDYDPGKIYMAVSRFGYAGVVRVEDNALNMAAAMDPVFVHEHGGIASAVTLILNEAGFPVPLGMASGRWLGTPRLTRKSDRTAAHRVLLVGDAAAYSEPFTGEGMSWALADATSVGAYVEQGIDEWAPGIERGWMSVHRRSTDRERMLSRLASSVLRSRPAVTFGLRVCRRFPVLAGPAVRFVCDREYARL